MASDDASYFEPQPRASSPDLLMASPQPPVAPPIVDLTSAQLASTNVTAQHAIASNSLSPNSPKLNSLTPNSLTPNSLNLNSLNPNSLTPNSPKLNSLTPNSLTPNSLTPNSPKLNSLSPNSLSPNSPKPNSGLSPTGSSVKPKRTTLEIFNMNVGFLGIQFGWGLQMANMSAIFEHLGAEAHQIPALWLAAPLTGLIVQPLIGNLSDYTWTPLGRRRPYFLVGALLAAIALVLMPHVTTISAAVLLLWLLDSSANVSMVPFRAFVGDLLSKEQRTQGFAMQSFMVGLGAISASVLPWILSHWFQVDNYTLPFRKIPKTVELSFYIGAIAFLLTILWTIVTTPEAPPTLENPKLEDSKLENPKLEDSKLEDSKLEDSKLEDSKLEDSKLEDSKLEDSKLENSKLEESTAIKAERGGLLRDLLKNKVPILRRRGNTNVCPSANGLDGPVLSSFAHPTSGNLFIGKALNSMEDTWSILQSMPKVMRQLAWVQGFTWLGIFCFFLYFPPVVARHIFGAVSQESMLYNQGIEWAGICFAVFNGVCIGYSLLLPTLVKWSDRRTVHSFSLLCGGISLVAIWVIQTPYLLLVSMVGFGITWASALSMPYAMLAGVIPAKRQGIYQGIFNLFIVIPEIFVALGFGWVMHHWLHDERRLAIVLGGVFLIIAAILTKWIGQPRVNTPKSL